MVRCLCIAILLGASALASHAASVERNGLTTSDTCGSCHVDIHRMWKGSLHARSMEDEVFLDSYHETDARQGAAVSKLCLGCHAPMVRVNGDWALREKITWEGVACDVCHSITSVEVGERGTKQTLDVGRVKRGPIKDAESTGHEVAYSLLHTTALVCAGCHEYVNSEGTPILTTYTEWRESPAAAEGKSCQSCHMAKTRASVVDPRVKRVNLPVNLHEMPGGHSLEQLHKSLAPTIRPQRAGGKLGIEIRLENKGAGHAVPTGMPGRRVILTVAVRSSDGGTFEGKRYYGKSFLDAHGDPIVRDSGYFAAGVKVKSDTRLLPGETRIETFDFPVPESATAYLTVKLQYEHAPKGNAENRTFLTFLSEERTLVPEAKKP